MTIVTPALPFNLTSSNRKIADAALEQVLNQHLKTADPLLRAEGRAALHSASWNISIEFVPLSIGSVYFRVRRVGVNLCAGWLSVPDVCGGLWTLGLSKRSRRWEPALLSKDWTLMWVEPAPLPALIQPRLPKGGKIVPLPTLLERATGRSRANAAPVILNKLEYIMKSVGFGAPGDNVGVRRGQLSLWFTKTPAGIYFAARHRNPAVGMTAYIDPQPRGKYAGGRLHAMSWKRGWEAALFDDGDWVVSHRDKHDFG
ncbi:MAG: hypothetical protein JWO15_993 [Sphingomonadales bacterium]|nr:hypothetical protein [Sphingomonadales bacterium]